MKEQFLRHIQESALCSRSDKLLLAVSGGLDSMVMLNLFHTTGFNVSVAHANFMLRAEESDGDEILVSVRCKELNIPLHVRRFQTSAYAEENGLSIQMAARELRYAWFDELMEQDGYTHLATAHHEHDNIETVLMNFIRGSKLKGIPEKNARVIRPLLSFGRQQLEHYGHEAGVQWRNDSSNATDDYTRNYIRHHITPHLEKLNPNFDEGFKRTLEQLASSAELAQQRIEQIRQEFVTHNGSRVIILKTLTSATTHPSRLLWEIINTYGFNLDQADEIISVFNGQPGKRFLSPGYQLVVDRDTLQITPHEKFWDPVSVSEGVESVVMGPWEMFIEEPQSVNIEADRFVAWLDRDRVTFPLTWRLWKEGDFFYPLGMDHKKKISDFLIDNKLSLADKTYVTVLESKGEIIWIPGYRIDNRFRITAGSRKALRLTLEQYFV